MKTRFCVVGCLVVVGNMILAPVSRTQMMLVSDAASLTFERPAAQGPGTPGSQTVSDPTIRPLEAPGRPATINKTLPIDFQGNGRPDLVACYGAFPTRSHASLPRAAAATRWLGCRNHPPDVRDGRLAEHEEPEQEIVSGDFNRDGRPDMFVAASGYDAAPSPGETNVLLISNADGTYTDRSATLPQMPDFSHSAYVGDINGDGNLDIYVGNWGGLGAPVGPYFLMGRGDGTFTQKTTGLPPSMSPESSLRAMTSSSRPVCWSISIGTRIRTWCSGPPPKRVSPQHRAVQRWHRGFHRASSPASSRRGRCRPTTSMVDIVSLDVNRDGRPDLLLLSSAQRTVTGFGLQVLINRGNGTFADETVARLGTSSLSRGSYCGLSSSRRLQR